MHAGRAQISKQWNGEKKNIYAFPSSEIQGQLVVLEQKNPAILKLRKLQVRRRKEPYL